MEQFFWAVVPSILVSVVMGYWNSRQKKKDREENEREKARLKSERLRISLLLAAAQLSYACAMAMKRGTPNGEIEVGVDTYNRALEEFRQFEREQVVSLEV